MRVWAKAPKASPVARFRPVLIRLLVAVLLLQSAVAGAHGLRGMAAGEGLLVEICSAEGLRTIRLDANDHPVHEHAPENGGGFCPLCASLPGIALPAPPHLATRAWLGTAISWHLAGAERLLRPGDLPPYATRAPPITA